MKGVVCEPYYCIPNTFSGRWCVMAPSYSGQKATCSVWMLAERWQWIVDRMLLGYRGFLACAG